MENKESFTNVRSLIGALAVSMNLISKDVEKHHERTAYLAYLVGREMGMETEDLHLTIYAALLHDLGAVVNPTPPNLKEIEANRRETARMGAEMIRDLEEYDTIADVIEICQNSYQENLVLLERRSDLSACPEIAGAIHLADIISVLLRPDEPILEQVPFLCQTVERCRGKELPPTVVDAFLRVSGLEFIWLDLAYNPHFLGVFVGEMHGVSLERAVRLTRLMSRIIDFRSHFTARHSAGVSATAKKLAELAGMSREECLMMEIAGNLHDVGKLRVPAEILEKPGKLTASEFNIIKEHPYYTRLILMNVDGFDRIANWAGFHHEKLNGRGYPFHFGSENLDLGSRIMSVADIFSAITEERPYRKPMTREEAVGVLRANVDNGGLDGAVVDLLVDHYEEINALRIKESQEAVSLYDRTKSKK